ncbi:MAG: amino acid permease [Desulfovibrio sp.]|nr:amino acid permease [Desulfovibrio sp.]
MPWAFLGFETAVHVADRHAFPRSRLFAVMAAAILAAALCYAGLTLLAIQHVPEGFAGWQDYVASLGKLEGPDSIPTFFVMQATFGRAGLVLLEATAMAALGTSLLGYLIVCSQLVCTLAESGVLQEALGRRSADGLPEGAMRLVPALCVTAPFLGRTVIEWFMPVITLGCTLAYGYTSASAYCAARAEGRPAAGAAGTAIACLLAIVLLMPLPGTAPASVPNPTSSSPSGACSACSSSASPPGAGALPAPMPALPWSGRRSSSSSSSALPCGCARQACTRPGKPAGTLPATLACSWKPRPAMPADRRPPATCARRRGRCRRSRTGLWPSSSSRAASCSAPCGCSTASSGPCTPASACSR